MLPSGNIIYLLVVILAGFAGGVAGAQEAEAPAMAWADGEAGFEWVQDWVRSEDGVPAEADLPNREVTGLFGVSITLREDGRVLGRGQALRADITKAIDQPGPAVQLPALLAAATRQALDELRDRQMKRAVELKISDPELFKQALLETRKRVQIDIQFGHSLESIVLPNDAKDEAVFTTFAPGFHGLRLAGPLAGKADYAWPATELAHNTSPPRIIFRLLEQQGYDADDLPLVARTDGPALQRFEIIHMVRPGAAQPMRQLIRGNLIVQQQVIDGRTIAGLAEGAARYLDQLVYTDNRTGALIVRGTYQPSAERYTPERADARETALLAYALTRHARINIDADLAGETMHGRVRRMLRLTNQLAPAALPEKGPPSHLTAAFLLLTLCESPLQAKPDQLVLRDRLARALIDLRHPEGGGFRVAEGSDKRLTRASAAVVTASLAAWYEQTRSKAMVEPLWAVLGELMKVNKDDPRVVDLVWVSHALSKAGPLLAKAHPDPKAAAKQLDAWNKALAEYVELLSEQQVRGKPVLGPEDVVGGFVLAPQSPGSPPNPDWQSAMPLTIMAISLRNPDVIAPDKSFGPLLTAGLGARFIGQLTISRPSTYYLRDPEPALGGVRANLWDNTLYPDCSSMALLALAELQKTLIELEPEDE